MAWGGVVPVSEYSVAVCPLSRAALPIAASLSRGCPPSRVARGSPTVRPDARLRVHQSPECGRWSPFVSVEAGRLIGPNPQALTGAGPFAAGPFLRPSPFAVRFLSSSAPIATDRCPWSATPPSQFVPRTGVRSVFDRRRCFRRVRHSSSRGRRSCDPFGASAPRWIAPPHRYRSPCAFRRTAASPRSPAKELNYSPCCCRS